MSESERWFVVFFTKPVQGRGEAQTCDGQKLIKTVRYVAQ